ncbi:hypothetical protein HUT18_08980 [Streptomyces sp. NA04227]|uniref:hypothetical protein n=1 Tax=Streptomyces sp. NA04227 TaxID=2742136 RepID=UPI001590CDBB|nr:hypothetical protein [Streptomyces sp. NA04227]QKW06517.1 hypothetical protein HUT18_08980 [Streptomyces sp. NA04227]
MTSRALDAALADPATLRAWQGERRRTRAAMVLWTLCLPGYAALAATAVGQGWASQFVVNIGAVPVVLVMAAGLVVSVLRWEQLGGMRGVLETYPWQELPAIGQAHPAGAEYCRLPDPDDPGKRVQVAFRRFGPGKRWRRVVTEARSAGLLCAGDPRFACVVALPGPRGLLAVRPQHTYVTDRDSRPDGVSEASWRRAQATGIAVPPSEEEQRRRLLSGLWKGFRTRGPA